jgi:hypothetical protein
MAADKTTFPAEPQITGMARKPDESSSNVEKSLSENIINALLVSSHTVAVLSFIFYAPNWKTLLLTFALFELACLGYYIQL